MDPPFPWTLPEIRPEREGRDRREREEGGGLTSEFSQYLSGS